MSYRISLSRRVEILLEHQQLIGRPALMIGQALAQSVRTQTTVDCVGSFADIATLCLLSDGCWDVADGFVSVWGVDVEGAEYNIRIRPVKT